MERKFLFLLCVCMLLGVENLNAQHKLMASFRDDFLKSFYESCPDSLKEDLYQAKTPEKMCTFKHITRLDLLEDIVSKEDDPGFILRYRAQDFCAYVRMTKDLDDFCFDFFYVSPKDSIQWLRLADSTGTYQGKLVTKSGQKYVIDHAWGFISIKENNFSLLDCYFSMDNQSHEFIIIPFQGTNTLVWSKLEDGCYIPAF